MCASPMHGATGLQVLFTVVTHLCDLAWRWGYGVSCGGAEASTLVPGALYYWYQDYWTHDQTDPNPKSQTKNRRNRRRVKLRTRRSRETPQGCRPTPGSSAVCGSPRALIDPVFLPLWHCSMSSTPAASQEHKEAKQAASTGCP